jgi:hypothetical protein
MTETPTDDRPGFVAEKPEHCHACYHLIQPGQTYFPTVGQANVCEGCIADHDAIRVTDDLSMVIEDGRFLVRRGCARPAEFSPEMRRLEEAGYGDMTAVFTGKRKASRP